jgi:hypothetical protein
MRARRLGFGHPESALGALSARKVVNLRALPATPTAIRASTARDTASNALQTPLASIS